VQSSQQPARLAAVVFTTAAQHDLADATGDGLRRKVEATERDELVRDRKKFSFRVAPFWPNALVFSGEGQRERVARATAFVRCNTWG
jgi:hypothetical protein